VVKYMALLESLMSTAKSAGRPHSGARPEPKLSDRISRLCATTPGGARDSGGAALGCARIRPGSAPGREVVAARSAPGLTARNRTAVGWALRDKCPLESRLVRCKLAPSLGIKFLSTFPGARVPASMGWVKDFALGGVYEYGTRYECEVGRRYSGDPLDTGVTVSYLESAGPGTKGLREKEGKMKPEVGMKLESIGRFLRERVGCQVEILPAENGYKFVIRKPPIVEDEIYVTPENVNAVVMMFWDAWHLAREYEKGLWTQKLQRLLEGEEVGAYAEKED